jgi:hypothetical protein
VRLTSANFETLALPVAAVRTLAACCTLLVLAGLSALIRPFGVRPGVSVSGGIAGAQRILTCGEAPTGMFSVTLVVQSTTLDRGRPRYQPVGSACFLQTGPRCSTDRYGVTSRCRKKNASLLGNGWLCMVARALDSRSPARRSEPVKRNWHIMLPLAAPAPCNLVLLSATGKQGVDTIDTRRQASSCRPPIRTF